MTRHKSGYIKSTTIKYIFKISIKCNQPEHLKIEVVLDLNKTLKFSHCIIGSKL